MAQNIPAFGEITRQEKNQQNADELNRLKSEQVDLGIARPRTIPEQDEQQRKPETNEQRHEGQLSEHAFVVHKAEQAHQHRAAINSLRKPGEYQAVAHRIAQAHHKDEADAGQQKNRDEQYPVAIEVAQPPPEIDHKISAEEQRRPQEKFPFETRRTPHHETRLEDSKLLRRQQRE